MRKILNSVLPAVLVFATTLSAFAHQGHGQENPLSPEHYLVNEVHLFPIALIVVVIAALTRTYFLKRSRTIKEK
jgi:hypothetical protein